MPRRSSDAPRPSAGARNRRLIAIEVLLVALVSACTIMGMVASARAGAPINQLSGVWHFGPGQKVPTIPHPGGLAVGTNVNVTQQADRQNETSIALDSDDVGNLVVGTNDYRNGDVDAGVAYSFDHGHTWTANTLAGLHASYGKYDAQGDPAVGGLRGGKFHYAFIDFDRDEPGGTFENRLAVATSSDGGVTWPLLGVIVDHQDPPPVGTQHDIEDKPYLAVDRTGGPRDGNIYVTWTRFVPAGSGRIMFSRSTDGGTSFSTPMQISDVASLFTQGSQPVIGPNGEIYVVWINSSTLRIDKSTDGGMSWGTDVVVASVHHVPNPLPGAQFQVPTFPSMAVDPVSGNVYVVWQDAGDGGTSPDILCTRSVNGGADWSTPIRVSDDDLLDNSYQFFPWICVKPGSGYIQVVFLDRRDAPMSTFYHAYYAMSDDQGLSFSPNVRLSDAISNAANDGFGGAFIGDYIGITASLRRVYACWTDIRGANANQEAYTAQTAVFPMASTPSLFLLAAGILLTGWLHVRRRTRSAVGVGRPMGRGRPRYGRPAALAVVAVLAGSAVATTCWAQSYNRFFNILTDGQTRTIQLATSIDTFGTAKTLDLSSRVVISQDGVPIDTVTAISTPVDDPGVPFCIELDCDDLGCSELGRTCWVNKVNDCFCVDFRFIISIPTEDPLPGTGPLTLTVEALPGASPEIDTSDDVLVVPVVSMPATRPSGLGTLAVLLTGGAVLFFLGRRREA